MVIIGTKTGSSWEHSYHELGIKFVVDHRCSHKLNFFDRIAQGFFPLYLQQILDSRDAQYYLTRAKSIKNIERFRARTKTFEDSYFPYSNLEETFTPQKIHHKFSINDFFSKCDQIRRKLRIWSHLLKKSLMENFIFCAVFMADKQSAHLTNTIAYDNSYCYMTISA